MPEEIPTQEPRGTGIIQKIKNWFPNFRISVSFGKPREKLEAIAKKSPHSDDADEALRARLRIEEEQRLAKHLMRLQLKHQMTSLESGELDSLIDSLGDDPALFQGLPNFRSIKYIDYKDEHSAFDDLVDKLQPPEVDQAEVKGILDKDRTPHYLTAQEREALRQLYVSCFNLDEIKQICFDVDIDYEDVRGENLTGKSREFISYLERRQSAYMAVDIIKSVLTEGNENTSLEDSLVSRSNEAVQMSEKLTNWRKAHKNTLSRDKVLLKKMSDDLALRIEKESVPAMQNTTMRDIMIDRIAHLRKISETIDTEHGESVFVALMNVVVRQCNTHPEFFTSFRNFLGSNNLDTTALE